MLTPFLAMTSVEYLLQILIVLAFGVKSKVRL